MTEKQIEEIAHAMCRNCEPNGHCRTDDEPCSMECVYSVCADRLYQRGYRKQREGKNVTENHPVDEFICSECGAIFRDVPLIVIDEDDGDELYYEFYFKYCPRCGAKIDTE